jgi:hydrogenase maturation protease
MSNPPSAFSPVVYVCGQPFRGDDAVGFAILDAIEPQTRNAATIVERGSLDVADLIALPVDARCIVVDAVAGIEPGALIELDLRDLAATEADASELRAATGSTHALSIPQTLRLARTLRGTPIAGTFIGVGIAQCVPGTRLSQHVAAAVPSAARSVASLIERHTAPGSSPC